MAGMAIVISSCLCTLASSDARKSVGLAGTAFWVYWTMYGFNMVTMYSKPTTLGRVLWPMYSLLHAKILVDGFKNGGATIKKSSKD